MITNYTKQFTYGHEMNQNTQYVLRNRYNKMDCIAIKSQKCRVDDCPVMRCKRVERYVHASGYQWG